jgi:adenosylcobinamide-GDP ribazoletransferase
LTGAEGLPSAHETAQISDTVGRGNFGDSFLSAVTFLTRLPVMRAAHSAPDVRRRSLVHFPVVGALIGGATAGTLLLTGLFWPIGLAVLLALLAEIVLTGGLHEDGLADCCDAFGGGWTRDDILRILKDSRVGTYGVLGLVFAVGLKAAAVYYSVTAAGLERWWLWGSLLVAAAAVGRWTMVLTLSVMAPVEDRESLSHRFAPGLSRTEFAGSVLWTMAAVLPYAVVQPFPCLVSAVLCAAGVWLLTGIFRRKLGGITGDCLGCIGYVSQFLVLLGGAVTIEPWTT